MICKVWGANNPSKNYSNIRAQTVLEKVRPKTGKWCENGPPKREKIQKKPEKTPPKTEAKKDEFLKASWNLQKSKNLRFWRPTWRQVGTKIDAEIDV